MTIGNVKGIQWITSNFAVSQLYGEFVLVVWPPAKLSLVSSSNVLKEEWILDLNSPGGHKHWS